MRLTRQKLAKLFILLGILLFLVAIILSFVGACHLWHSDKSHAESMLSFAVARLATEWKFALVLGIVPLEIGIAMLMIKKESNQQDT